MDKIGCIEPPGPVFLMSTMKAIIFVVLLACAAAVELKEGITPRKLPAIEVSQEALPKVTWEEIRTILLTKGDLKAGFIQADVTDYAIKVLTYVRKLVVEEGLDPLELSEQQIKLIPTGTVNLTDGWLEQLSTMNVSDSVIAKYSTSTKIVELTLPLYFDSLLITYDYHTKVLLLDLQGSVDAEVSNVKLNLHMGFNFTSHHFFVDKADVKDSGTITVKFSGLGLVDWLIDLLTGVMVTLFHGLILSIINLVIDNPVQTVVDTLNNYIDSVLQQNVTSVY